MEERESSIHYVGLKVRCEVEYNIHVYVFISVEPPENNTVDIWWKGFAYSVSC